MAINADKPNLWKADVARSIHFYNDSFLRFAASTYCKQWVIRTKQVLAAFEKTDSLETRKLAALKRWLLRHGYKQIKTDDAGNCDAMPPGTFTFRHTLSAGKKKTPVNIPLDCIVKPIHASEQDQPFVLETKSSGNAATTNRWRKKEAQKFAQIKGRYGKNVKFILLLCGHFDSFYLGHQAAEGIDWVWEHRLDDLSALLAGGKKTS